MKHLKKFEGIDDYTKLSGWVNIKIDEQIYIRMAKYVSALDTLPTFKKVIDKYDLYKKIKVLSNIDEYVSESDIQTKIAIITLLQYFNEIKDKFNPSSAGFLFEGFLATLIHGIKDSDPRGSRDINSSYSEIDAIKFKMESGRGVKKLNYQIKLYRNKGYIKINWSEVKKCDYYVIALKNPDLTIDIHILSIDPNDLSYIGNYVKIPSEYKKLNRSDEYVNNLISSQFDEIEIYTNKLSTHKDFKVTLNISTQHIESLISSCGENIKNSIGRVYDSLSELHYDIDSLVTGYNKNKVKIPVETAESNANQTISRITNDLINLSGNLNQ